MSIEVDMTRPAADILKEYMLADVNAYLYEMRNSGIDPILFPRTFIQYELLAEPEHQDVRAAVRNNSMVVDVDQMAMWIDENRYEVQSRTEHRHRLTPAKITLTNLARHRLLKYFTANPDLRDDQKREHAIDPLYYPEVFFRSEVSVEPWHRKIVDEILHDNYIVDLKIVDDWIAEEARYPSGQFNIPGYRPC